MPSNANAGMASTTVFLNTDHKPVLAARNVEKKRESRRGLLALKCHCQFLLKINKAVNKMNKSRRGEHKSVSALIILFVIKA